MSLRHFITLLALLTILPVACTSRKTVQVPYDRTSRSDQAARDRQDPAATLDSGRDLADPHLAEWRRAESHYEKQYESSSSNSVLDQLLLTRFLVLMRELDEGIFSSSQTRRLDSLCSWAISDFHQALCRAAREGLGTGNGNEATIDASKSCLNSSPLGQQDPMVAAYLHLLQAKTPAPSCAHVEKARGILNQAEVTPLALYLSMRKGRLGDPAAHLGEHPRFGELLAYQGQSLLEARRYRQGIEALARAVELIPDYTKALFALGESHLSTLHLDQRALGYFDEGLRWDPKHVAGLFGRGVALHFLGRYGESQAALDSLLGDESARWGTVSNQSRRSYQGKVCYYKSYNYYLSESPEEARRWVDRALTHLPQSKSALYLSAILHLDRDRTDQARADLLRVVDGGTEICDAYYRLGVSQSVKPSRKVLYNFMNAGYCFERRVRGLREELDLIPDLELDQTRKDEMSGALKNSFNRLGDEAAATLFNMMNRASSIEALDATVFLRSMEELWGRLIEPSASR